MDLPFHRKSQRFLMDRVGASSLRVFNYYGVAEVDAGCLVARDRNLNGEPIYFPRDSNVEVDIVHDKLVLAIKTSQGDYLVRDFQTGDYAYRYQEGYCIPRDNRAAENIIRRLESWEAEQWTQRTGYLFVDQKGKFKFQTRRHRLPKSPSDLSFFQFSDLSGQTFLSKPIWSETT